MVITHLYSLIPLGFLLLLSLRYTRCGLLHLGGLGYTAVLAWMAVYNQWEIVFFPFLLISAILELILFSLCMAEGSWY